MKKQPTTNLARALFRFFQDYLPAQRGMRLHTIHSYRDTVQLLLEEWGKLLGDVPTAALKEFRRIFCHLARSWP